MQNSVKRLFSFLGSLIEVKDFSACVYANHPRMQTEVAELNNWASSGFIKTSPPVESHEMYLCNHR